VIGAVLVTFPGCVDTHAAVRVLHDDWIGCFWLRFMPSVYLLVDRRNGLVLIDKLLRLGVAWFGVE
jgi:hypothetical protein